VFFMGYLLFGLFETVGLERVAGTLWDECRWNESA